jgi:hypothetical protein
MNPLKVSLRRYHIFFAWIFMVRVVGFILLVAGCWLLGIGYWVLVTGDKFRIDE